MEIQYLCFTFDNITYQYLLIVMEVQIKQSESIRTCTSTKDKIRGKAKVPNQKLINGVVSVYLRQWQSAKSGGIRVLKKRFY